MRVFSQSLQFFQNTATVIILEDVETEAQLGESLAQGYLASRKWHRTPGALPPESCAHH